MDIKTLRRLALRSLRIADLITDPQEATELRRAAADYFEQAERATQQQQQIQPNKKDEPQ